MIAASAALLIALLLSDRPGFTWLRYVVIALPVMAIALFSRAEDLEIRRIAAIFIFFVAAMVFWSAFEQAGLTIAIFADRLTDNAIGNWTIPSAWYQSLNPLFVIALAPVMAAQFEARPFAVQQQHPLGAEDAQVKLIACHARERHRAGQTRRSRAAS